MSWTDSRKFRSRNPKLIQYPDNLSGVDLAAVEFDPDARAYAVIHIVSIQCQNGSVSTTVGKVRKAGLGATIASEKVNI
jgi:hypothetical protein